MQYLFSDDGRDIPGRSIVRLEDDVLAELARHPNIAGIKDATADCASNPLIEFDW